jgi:predicted RNA-binding Zn-ribbon protein involved in translation (DUF1610 family)
MNGNNNEVLCPKCGSNKITANQKGFSGGKALTGALLTGSVGLLAGTIGSKKVIITCLSCGKQFKPGEGLNQATNKATVTYKTLPKKQATRGEIKAAKIMGIIFSVITIPLTILFYAIGETGFGVFFTIISLLMILVACRKVPAKEKASQV